MVAQGRQERMPKQHVSNSAQHSASIIVTFSHEPLIVSPCRTVGFLHRPATLRGFDTYSYVKHAAFSEIFGSIMHQYSTGGQAEEGEG